VGVLSGDGSAVESEIWGAAEDLMPAFRRSGFSSVTGRLAPGEGEGLRARLEADPRLGVDVRGEIDYWGAEGRGLALFVRLLGVFLAVLFALGALLGAMMTLYGQLAARRREIGTLRALGFSRGAVLLGFLVEAELLALSGGALGLGLAALMSRATFSVMNLATVSEVVFRFRLGPGVLLHGLHFAIIIGLLGGLLPALKAARLPIAAAIRA
jgi:hypothetical protein